MKKRYLPIIVILAIGLIYLFYVHSLDFIPDSANVRDIRINDQEVTDDAFVSEFQSAFLELEVIKRQTHYEWHNPKNVRYKISFMVGHVIYDLVIADNTIIYNSDSRGHFYIVDPESDKHMRTLIDTFYKD